MFEMKIDSNYPNYEVDPLSHRTANVPAEKPGHTETGRSQETEKASPDAVVNLSRESREAQLIKDTIEKSQDIRQEKVDQLKKEISNNTYQINPKAIAGKMISYFTNEFFTS
jgi:negative regulator of flagellin synthesis FlgM